MKFKPKDIIVLVVSLAVMITASYYAYNMLRGGSNTAAQTGNKTTTEDVVKIPDSIDDKAVQQVENLKNYGKPSLDNIGRTDPDNPFAPIQ